MERYASAPTLFVEEVLGATPQEWQRELLDAYGSRSRRISVRSGHGVGKSTVLAWMMVHHLVCRFPQKTVVTAPTASQLYDALWAEFKSWMGKLPPNLLSLFVLKQDRVELAAAPNESFATARTSRAEQPEALQGVHSEWVLLVADEASGVPEQVFEAAAGSMSGHNAVTVLAGNPVRGQGFFFDTHHKLADMWTTLVVPCMRSPFVAADYIEDMKRRYGAESNAFRVRVLGEFPVADDDTVIPFDLVEAARHRDVKPATSAQVVWGVDCARFGSDKSALVKRRANVLLELPKTWAGLDTMQLAGRIKHEYDETPLMERPAEINVDSIGIGSGVVDRLRQLGLPARGINVSETPAVGEKYRNLRAELWFRARDWFAKRDCLLPEPHGAAQMQRMDDFIRELTAIRYNFAATNGRIIVESKHDLKKRGFDSPDMADAFILTFASHHITLLQGDRGMRTWRKPLDRPLKGLV